MNLGFILILTYFAFASSFCSYAKAKAKGKS
jgi:hypothetical protein